MTSFITTSWDDGHPLDLRLAALLHKYSIRGTFYLPLNNERPLLTVSQIRELSVEFEVGAHTTNHCDLLTVPNYISHREITDCKTQLEEISGKACSAFCFPKGHFRRSHLSQVRRAGYRVARTVELMWLEGPRMHTGLEILPTTIQAVPAKFATYTRNSLKRLRPASLLRYVRHRGSDWVSTAESLLEQVVSLGGVFHLWGHSWEIDQLGQWENLERLLEILAKCKGHATFVDNTGLSKAVQR